MRNIREGSRGTRVAQSVKHATLNLSSDLDLRVVCSSPALGMEPTLKKTKQKKTQKTKTTYNNKKEVKASGAAVGTHTQG